jgi:hypothetical protein
LKNWLKENKQQTNFIATWSSSTIKKLGEKFQSKFASSPSWIQGV